MPRLSCVDVGTNSIRLGIFNFDAIRLTPRVYVALFVTTVKFVRIKLNKRELSTAVCTHRNAPRDGKLNEKSKAMFRSVIVWYSVRVAKSKSGT